MGEEPGDSASARRWWLIGEDRLLTDEEIDAMMPSDEEMAAIAEQRRRDNEDLRPEDIAAVRRLIALHRDPRATDEEVLRAKQEIPREVLRIALNGLEPHEIEELEQAIVRNCRCVASNIAAERGVPLPSLFPPPQNVKRFQ
ncbi:unnamed protein product [Vitrella brassicaformis CCMP3155]|uniref:Uncharacterized protein n=1 Tax=Vitrella brassicaformis (strain CCMP3155) TaxID=1169540 RepID=A0A0G4EKH3_VITBC|nr:unnamed protein product [Vitrella brassicaformis CCMP3155]|eukprot:CEL97945.1 unnamed protein product [Vitrella brassicaformis CCMP3155]